MKKLDYLINYWVNGSAFKVFILYLFVGMETNIFIHFTIFLFHGSIITPEQFRLAFLFSSVAILAISSFIGSVSKRIPPEN